MSTQHDDPADTTPLQPPYPVVTERLRLRPVHADDLEAVYAHRSIPDVALYLPHPPHTREDTERTIATMVSQQALAEPGHWLDLAVELAETGDVIGEVLLKRDPSDSRMGEVGFAFHPSVHGTGIPTEAVSAALRIAFDDFGWHRVTGICDVRNTKSVALMERLGMRREAEFREAVWVKGEWVSDYVYAILRSEWVERGAE